MSMFVATTTAEAELLLFGGSGQDEFLGCVDCGEFSSDSICNEFGKYGNEFNTGSISNDFGKYGNSFASQSPYRYWWIPKEISTAIFP